ncbi:unnamed protein product [Rhizopus stolonifer]
MVIRQEICEYLKENEETYQYFIEDDQSFEDYLENMQQDGTFGGNIELAAFAKLNKLDIKVYQPGLIYVIEGVEKQISEQKLHIAYHDWEHYSSIRNLDGPFTGLPEIKCRPEENDEKAEEEYDSKEKVVLNACPDASIRRIRRLLRKYKGNPDKVIDVLYEMEDHASDTQLDMEQESVKEDPIQIETKQEIVKETMQEVVEIDVKRDFEKDLKKDTNEDINEKEEQETKEDLKKEKPKRLSASDRKKEAKKKQKETKLAKHQARIARRTEREKRERIRQYHKR